MRRGLFLLKGLSAVDNIRHRAQPALRITFAAYA